MGKVVNPIATRVRCEMHPCKERAAFALCEGGRRQVAFNVCEKHLRQIVEEGLEALNMLEDVELDENGDPIILDTAKTEPELGDLILGNEDAKSPPTVDGDPVPPIDEVENAAESDENAPEEPTAPEPQEVAGEQKTEVENAEETEQLAPEPEEKSVTVEVYTCKHCGETFPKTNAGRSALMIHSKNCPSKPPKE